ncbi:MAG TPA: heparinase II/III family protein [Candidatus Limnocylindria bacterium]
MEPSDAQGQAPGEFDPAPAYPPTAGGTTAGGPSARELWDQGRQVRFGGFPIFRVPRDPTWAEDPFDDTTWLRHYHSLTWLRIPGQAYLETGETRYRVQVKRYLLDWIEANPRGAAPSHRAWFDGAVGYRTDVMVELFRPVLAGALTAHERSLFRESLVAHGGALSTYLRRVGLAGHNHNLFHALQLYNLSVAFPKLPGAGDWRSAARRRVSSLLPEMVSLNEGVSLEQAASYHLLAMELFNKADQFLDRFDDGLSRRERQTLASMAGFAALLLSPTQEMPAIGDTPYGAGGWKRLVALRQAGLTDPFADYVLTHGRSGQRPPDSNFFPESGYAILRPTYSPGEAWSRDLQLVVDMSARARPHGHDDVMNILLTAHGHSLLIDSGGPYAYGKPGRRDFVSALAHNVVVADDASAEPGPLRTLVGMDTAAHAVVAGSYMVAPGVRDHRTVLLAKPDLVLVVDRLRATDREQHRYRLLYHLPPDATVMAAGTAGEVQAGTAGMGFRIVGRRSLRMDVVRGQADPPLGWVTKRHLARKPAAVLKVAQTGRDAWFVSVLAPSSAGDARAPQVRVAERGSALVVTVIRAERTDRFRIGADGTAWLAG